MLIEETPRIPLKSSRRRTLSRDQWLDVRNRVMMAASRVWGTTEGMICGSTRPTPVVDCRLAVYAGLIGQGMTTEEAGQAVGNRNRTTVSYGVRAFHRLHDTDEKFRSLFSQMMTAITQSNGSINA